MERGSTSAQLRCTVHMERGCDGEATEQRCAVYREGG